MSKTLLLLHGALGSESQLHPLKEMMNGGYDVHSFNFAGHGGKALPETFSIKSFAEETVLFCEANEIKSVSIFGYSMGGYVALYLAKHYPYLVESVITLGTKLRWDEAAFAFRAEISALNAFRKSTILRYRMHLWPLTSNGSLTPSRATKMVGFSCAQANPISRNTFGLRLLSNAITP